MIAKLVIPATALSAAVADLGVALSNNNEDCSFSTCVSLNVSKYPVSFEEVFCRLSKLADRLDKHMVENRGARLTAGNGEGPDVT